MSDKIKLRARILMAWGKVRETHETQRELLRGCAAVNVLAVNPDRKEQNLILKSDVNLDPIVYTDTTTVKDSKGNDVEVPRTRITWIVKTDPRIACNNGIETTQFLSFFLSKGYVYSHKDGVTKVQVIDRFGRTAWVTAEELKEHKIPVYKISKGPRAGQMMPANLDPQYHKAYIGEADLIAHMRAFLNFPRPDEWNNDAQTYVMKTNPQDLADAESYFTEEDFQKIFSGDVSLIKDTIMGVNVRRNAYKIMFGVKTKDDGTLQQAVYMSAPMNLAIRDYKAWEKMLMEDAAANPPRHPNIAYLAGPLEKYVAAPTDYSNMPSGDAGEPEAPVDDLPFDSSPFGEESF